MLFFLFCMLCHNMALQRAVRPCCQMAPLQALTRLWGYISWTLCRRLPCGAHANAAATLMRLGEQNPGVCEAIRQSGAVVPMADMLICRTGSCRLCYCSHKQWPLHVSTCNL
jgi:hypothetical protein